MYRNACDTELKNQNWAFENEKAKPIWQILNIDTINLIKRWYRISKRSNEAGYMSIALAETKVIKW